MIVASPVSEILLLLKIDKFSFWTVIIHGGQKLNQIELAQKIHASRG